MDCFLAQFDRTKDTYAHITLAIGDNQELVQAKNSYGLSTNMASFGGGDSITLAFRFCQLDDHPQIGAYTLDLSWFSLNQLYTVYNTV